MVVRALFLLAAIVLLPSPVKALAADTGPVPMERNQPPHAQPPQPPAPPSKIDPGIQKQPDTVPNSKAIVTPPVVDPHMAIDPEKKTNPSEATPPPNSGGSPSPKK
ncbi:MAG: hypothetical protein ABI856_12965 [Nitrospira sp.]